MTMSSLLQAEDLLYKKYPAFSVHFDEYFGVFYSTSAQDPYDTESSKAQTNETQQQIQSSQEGTCFQVPGSFKRNSTRP